MGGNPDEAIKAFSSDRGLLETVQSINEYLILVLAFRHKVRVKKGCLY